MKFETFEIFKIWIDLRVGKHTVSENATFSSVSDDMSLQNLLSLPALDALSLFLFLLILEEMSSFL